MKSMLIDEISKIENQINDLNRKKGSLIKEYIDTECGVKVNSIVTINGYSHIGKRMVVGSISLHKDFKGNHYFKAKGRVLNKDGTPSKINLGEWFSNR
jgi:hypothetical protein